MQEHYPVRRQFTIQLYDTPVHAHDCHECGKRWECRLDCTIEWVPDDREIHPLDLGADTLCAECQSSIGEATR